MHDVLTRVRKDIQALSPAQLAEVRALADFILLQKGHGKAASAPLLSIPDDSYEDRARVQVYELLSSILSKKGVKIPHFRALPRVGCVYVYQDAFRSVFEVFCNDLVGTNATFTEVLKAHGAEFHRFLSILVNLAHGRLVRAGVRPQLKPILQQLSNSRSLLNEAFPEYGAVAFRSFVLQTCA